MRLENLKSRHAGEDVYVVGSGATLDHIDPRFFDGRTVVAVNLAADGLQLTAGTTYVHSHYHRNIAFQLARNPDWNYVAPLGDQGYAGNPSPWLTGVTYYQHYPTGGEFTGDYHHEGLMVGSSSIHGAMHLAAYMGAANIILCGADCGTLDGATNYAAYEDEHGFHQSGDLIVNDALSWLRRWNDALVMVKARLVKDYGVRVMSLNPFVNPNMEGHAWLSPAGRLN